MDLENQMKFLAFWKTLNNDSWKKFLKWNKNESTDLKQKLTGYSAPIYQSKKQINRLRKGFGFLHTHVYNIITLRWKIREIQSKDIKEIVIRYNRIIDKNK
jgi:tRNA A58 N-methylase Trm61